MSMGPLTMDMMMPVPPDIPTDPTLWATVPVSVGDTDVAGLGVPLRAPAFVSAAERNSSAAPPNRRPISSADAGHARPRRHGRRRQYLAAPGPRPGAERTIRRDRAVHELRARTGKYFVRVPFSFGGWTLLSASVGGRDAADTARCRERRRERRRPDLHRSADRTLGCGARRAGACWMPPRQSSCSRFSERAGWISDRRLEDSAWREPVRTAIPHRRTAARRWLLRRCARTWPATGRTELSVGPFAECDTRYRDRRREEDARSHNDGSE